MHVVVLNGSLRGEDGDGAALSARVRARAEALGHSVDCVVLATLGGSVQALVDRLARADGFVVVTGTYWGSWGSPLQRFFEHLTPCEATPVFLGKPCAAVVSMDSVSGAEVGARLLSVLNLFGCAVVPLGLVALSRVGRVVEHDADYADVWQLRDVDVLVENVSRAMSTTTKPTVAWEVHRDSAALDLDYRAPGALAVGVPGLLDVKA
jgi:NAD(P)H-dependent FMN reductase